MSLATAERPPYVLLSDRLPQSTTSKLLGRIVADPLFPRDEFVPDNPLFSLREPPLEVTDSNVGLTFDANRDQNVQAKLYKLFQMEAARGAHNEAEFSSKRVITRTLEQHRKAWHDIYAKHRAEILQMLATKQCKGTAYMVVAIKSFIDAEVEYKRGNQNTVVLRTELPVAETVAALGGGMPVIQQNANPTIVVERSFKADWLQKNTADGEQVFAIRYRIIKMKRAGSLISRSREQMAEYGGVHRVDWGHGVMGKDDEEEFVFEDDEAQQDDSHDEEEAAMVDNDIDPSMSALFIS